MYVIRRTPVGARPRGRASATKCPEKGRSDAQPSMGGEPTVPIYEYHCEACDHDFTVIESLSAHEAAKPKCPECESKSDAGGSPSS